MSVIAKAPYPAILIKKATIFPSQICETPSILSRCVEMIQILHKKQQCVCIINNYAYPYIQAESSTSFFNSIAKLAMVLVIYQENVINAGFSASGNNKWLAVTVAMGRMATKSVISQP